LSAPGTSVLVTGGTGRLGRALSAVDAGNVCALGRAELDITDADAVASALARLRPSAVINAAAASGVDAAEQHAAQAEAVNAHAPGLLAAACLKAHVPLIHVSTDYVFGADTDRPWREDDPVSPINRYGRTKAEGERRVLAAGGRACIVRVAWLFGDGGDFIARLLTGGRTEVAVAADQVGSPTPIHAAAARLLQLAARMVRADVPVPPVLHVAGTPPVARAKWVAHVFAGLQRLGSRPPRLLPVPADTLPSVAMRPRFSALDSHRATALFGSPMRWQDADLSRWSRLLR
jgi:dTDP-4-dehydrorhamnose reductase